jgi:NAD(P)-dependent dehydrogenase (short-subunit alcohol dehydrogenase family)
MIRIAVLDSASLMATPTDKKKAAIVTGASRGIGAATARLLGAQGYPVAVNFLKNEGAATAVVRDIEAGGGKAIAIRADISRESEIVKLFEASDRELGLLGSLVNNAAITRGFARVQDLTLAALTEVLTLNIAGTMLCAREAVRRMSTASGGSGGAIVNISSIAARTGAAGEWVHYAASKGAINSFTMGLAREVATQGIRVNAVAPGLIETDLHADNGAPDRLQRLNSSIPMRRPGTAAEVAAAIAWLLSPAASYVTGSILEVGGGR